MNPINYIVTADNIKDIEKLINNTLKKSTNEFTISQMTFYKITSIQLEIEEGKLKLIIHNEIDNVSLIETNAKVGETLKVNFVGDKLSFDTIVINSLLMNPVKEQK